MTQWEKLDETSVKKSSAKSKKKNRPQNATKISIQSTLTHVICKYQIKIFHHQVD
jgi:hypothetical protein